MSSTETLATTYVVPGFTFFYYGFDLRKRIARQFIDYFHLGEGHLVTDVILVIRGKPHRAKIRMARQRDPKYPQRDVVQIFYESEQETLKALRKLFLYSYATTIDKKRPRLKEIMQLGHLGDNRFEVVPFARQETDFDGMFNFMEDKNLFDYWKDYKKGGKQANFFINFSKKWLDARELEDYKDRINVIYLLYHSENKQLYVGKANRLGDRVKNGIGRVGLADDWDRFMFFEINPDYNAFIEQIEAFVIRTFASLLENNVGMAPLNEKGIKLVNKQLIGK
ncbi:MAG: GIY-YIG nuclease family protein [Nitrososphaerales archaeon]|jgi:hypothetical protein